jgi:hypothetical protein
MWLVMLTALVLGLGALAAQAPAAGAQESDGEGSGAGQAEPNQSEDNADSAPDGEPAPDGDQPDGEPAPDEDSSGAQQDGDDPSENGDDPASGTDSGSGSGASPPADGGSSPTDDSTTGEPDPPPPADTPDPESDPSPASDSASDATSGVDSTVDVAAVASVLAPITTVVDGAAPSMAAGPIISAVTGDTVDQCNNIGTVDGDTIACTVTITNDFMYNAARPDQPTGQATIVVAFNCTRPAECPVGETTFSMTPITVITQCNNTGTGAGSTVTCTVSVTNNLTGYPVGAVIDSTVLQCQDPKVAAGEDGCTATPPGNNRAGTAGPGGQSVTQCNSSGGARGTLTCDATAPDSRTTGLPTTIDQCNSSGSGLNGGGTVTCTATIVNIFDGITSGDDETGGGDETGGDGETGGDDDTDGGGGTGDSDRGGGSGDSDRGGGSDDSDDDDSLIAGLFTPGAGAPIAERGPQGGPGTPVGRLFPSVPGDRPRLGRPNTRPVSSGPGTSPPRGGQTTPPYGGTTTPPGGDTTTPPGEPTIPFTGLDIRLSALLGIVMVLLAAGLQVTMRQTARSDRS